MPIFQGSGFSIDLPDRCADTSVYTFLLPTPDNAPMAPFVTIQSEHLEGANLESHVRALHQALQRDLEAFRVLEFKAGQHAGNDVVLTNVQWGPAGARISQEQAFYLVNGEKKKKVFSLKGTDLTDNFGNSQPAFNHIFRTFAPNDIQLLPDPV